MKGTEMTVLSYRARRFVRHNLTWHNIRFQWAVVGLFVYALANLGVQTLSIYAGLPLLFLGCFLAVQFWYAALFFPYPMDYPWSVKKYDDLKDWWSKVSEPARIGTFQGKAVLERWVFGDFRYIYNRDGRLVATEQTIDWSSTDPDWRFGDQVDVQIIVTQCDGTERLPWLARLRSPKLPEGNQADIIDRDGIVIGNTAYNVKH